MRLLWEDRAWEDYLYWQMEFNRIVYFEQNGIIYVVSCRGHYED